MRIYAELQNCGNVLNPEYPANGYKRAPVRDRLIALEGVALGLYYGVDRKIGLSENVVSAIAEVLIDITELLPSSRAVSEKRWIEDSWRVINVFAMGVEDFPRVGDANLRRSYRRIYCLLALRASTMAERLEPASARREFNGIPSAADSRMEEFLREYNALKKMMFDKDICGENFTAAMQRI